MYLKRLELSGFKTFAHKTDFEFDPGITAVVGPNGVGKSNVADALMWALGEQSMRVLRSPSSQDIIFAGSNSRRPMGMAEVSVTLDNSDGRLPIEFSEVTVTRRLFRSGDSEYLLNKARCRLRDIQDLLADTGIGRHAYSVVTQGEIDAVLSIRSEDRRELIETVAGIQKYRARRRETLRKLDQTNANITRLSDLIHELASQREPLEQEAKVAAEYKELSARLDAAERVLLAEDYLRRRERLGRQAHDKDIAEKELAEAQAELAQLDQEEERLRAEQEQLDRELDELRRRAAEARADAERAQSAQALAAERERHIRDRRADLDRRVEIRTARLAALTQEAAAAATDRQTLTQKATGLEQQLQARRAEAQAAREAEQAAAREVAAAAEERHAAAAHIEGLQREIEGLETMQQELQERLARLQARAQALRDRQEGLQRQQAEAERLAQEREAAHAALMAELDTGREDLRVARQAMAAHRRKTQILSQSVAHTETRLQALQELELSREGYAAGVRAIMDAAEQGELQGIRGTIGELLEVPARYELAIEAALGEKLRWVVTETLEDARAALKLLAESGAGRATCLPLAALERGAIPPPASISSARREILGTADRLVRFGRRYRRVFEYLLGQVCVVQDLDTALDFSRRVGTRARFVTLDGESLDPFGALTGGAAASEDQAEIRRRREARELQAQLDSRTPSLEAMQRLENAADRSIYTLEAELLQSEERLAASQAALAEARRDAAYLQEQQAAAQEAQQELEEEIGEQRRKIEELGQRAAEAQTRRQRLMAEQDRLDQPLAAAQERLRQAQAATQEREREQTAAQVAHAELAERLRAQEQAENLLQAEIERLEREAAEAREERQRLDQQERDLAATAAENAELAQTKQAEAQAAQEEVARREAAGTELREALGRLGGARRRLQELVNDLQTRIRRAESGCAREETELEHITQRLADQYELTPDQAVAQRPADVNVRDLTREANEIRAQIRALGPVHVGAEEEYQRIKAREDFLDAQRQDLHTGREDLLQIIREIDEETRQTFLETFHAVAESFQLLFRQLFGGGDTTLTLTDPDNVLESGVEVIVQPPGKKSQNLLLLSGGERALTAMALVFAMLRVKPSPFCVLDEIDAPLDEINIRRFARVLRDFAQSTQFIVITHNRGTMEEADTLIGVTMSDPGISMRIAVTLQEAQALAEQPAPRRTVQHQLDMDR